MIPVGYFWINIFLLAAGTFSIRMSIIALSSKLQISQRTRELFTYIPAAILPAFVAPAIFFHEGHVGFLFGKERLAILVMATAVCAFTRSTLITIVFGLIALYLLSQF